VPKGGTKEAWVLAILIERKSEYYFWKAVLPLALVMFFSSGINIYPVDDLSNRMSMTTTMFLATFAVLYVISSDLPKTHFLTSIDKVVTATLVFMALIAANSWVCYSLYENGEHKAAEMINTVVTFLFPCLYIVGVMITFLPAIERKSKTLAQVVDVVPDKSKTLAPVDVVPSPSGSSTTAKNQSGTDPDFVNPLASLADTSGSDNEIADTVEFEINGVQTVVDREKLVRSFFSKQVLWTGSLTSMTGYEDHPSKTWGWFLTVAGIPKLAKGERFHGMAGRAGAFVWLAAKFLLLALLIVMCLTHVHADTRRQAWFAPIMVRLRCTPPAALRTGPAADTLCLRLALQGVIACALPSSGMPVAGGIVFVPTLTLFAGMDPSDAVAFSAATQTVGVGMLVPINWLFHDRRVFVRDGRGDVLWLLLVPSWLGVGLTRLTTLHESNRGILIAFTFFLFFVAVYTFYSVLISGVGAVAKEPDVAAPEAEIGDEKAGAEGEGGGDGGEAAGGERAGSFEREAGDANVLQRQPSLDTRSVKNSSAQFRAR
jgi:uncharacterized membrane protein YfcA